jgi:radical SAM superfamily enzyme
MRAMMAGAAVLLLCWTSCNAEEEEIRDRYLLVMQEHGGLAPGTRPTCFPAWKTQIVEHYYKTCPWDEPRRPRRPARSWDIIDWR